jgi:hypothetical protein
MQPFWARYANLDKYPCGFHLHDAMLNVFHIENDDLVANHDEV